MVLGLASSTKPKLVAGCYCLGAPAAFVRCQIRRHQFHVINLLEPCGAMKLRVDYDLHQDLIFLAYTGINCRELRVTICPTRNLLRIYHESFSLN